MTEYVLPHSKEAEETVLASCLISVKATETVVEALSPQEFYLPRHQLLFAAVRRLHDEGVEPDLIAVADQLEHTSQLAEAGGREYLHQLAALVPATTNVHHHARIILEHSRRRDLIRVGENIARSGWEPSGLVDEMIDQAEQTVLDLATGQTGDLKPLRETLPHTYQLLEQPGGQITGTATGLRDLDTLTAGFQPGNLVVIAARPGMGKSALALQAAYHNAVQLGRSAAVFTLEMSDEEINQRLLSIHTRVPLMRIRNRTLTGEDWASVEDARPTLEAAPLHVDDTAGLRLLDIRARTRRQKQRTPDLALVVVDYLQLMLADQRDENRNLEVARISRGLKLLAREQDVPVLALAQLNRNVEHRHDRRPILSDLRDSGAIEQDADLVLFIYRPDEEDAPAELTLAKHRNGPTGKTEVAWLKRRATFGNLATLP